MPCVNACRAIRMLMDDSLKADCTDKCVFNVNYRLNDSVHYKVVGDGDEPSLQLYRAFEHLSALHLHSCDLHGSGWVSQLWSSNKYLPSTKHKTEKLASSCWAVRISNVRLIWLLSAGRFLIKCPDKGCKWESLSCLVWLLHPSGSSGVWRAPSPYTWP